MLKITTLKKRQDFLRLRDRGHKYVTPAFVVQAIPNPKMDEVRVGYTASRKVGGAVERNRAKRRLRALVRLVLPEKGSLGGDYVLIARTAILKRPFDQLKQDLSKAIDKLYEAHH